MVSLHWHAPHIAPATSIWGMVTGVIFAPIVIIGGLFLLVRLLMG